MRILSIALVSFFCCGFILFLSPKSSAGEITFTEWNGVFAQLDITYFDTAGSKAICTVFFEGKPVGADSAHLVNGIATIRVVVPKGVYKNSKATYACRTE